MIKDIQAQGAAIFLTTHYIEEAEALADRVAFLRQGEIVALGSPSELMAAKGAWACLELTGQAPTRFFADRETALAQAAASGGEITVRRTMALLRALARDEGKAVLASLHDINLARRFADDVLLLAPGRVHGFGPPETVLTEQALRRVYGVEVLRLEGDGMTGFFPIGPSQ